MHNNPEEQVPKKAKLDVTSFLGNLTSKELINERLLASEVSLPLDLDKIAQESKELQNSPIGRDIFLEEQSQPKRQRLPSLSEIVSTFSVEKLPSKELQKEPTIMLGAFEPLSLAATEQEQRLLEKSNKQDIFIEAHKAMLIKIEEKLKNETINSEKQEIKSLIDFLNKDECMNLGIISENYHTEKGHRRATIGARTKQLIWDYEKNRLILLLTDKSEMPGIGSHKKASLRKGYVIKGNQNKKAMKYDFSEGRYRMLYPNYATTPEKHMAIVAFNNKILVEDFGDESSDEEFEQDQVISDTLAQLLALHDSGLIQFDIKPANLCIAKDGSPTIIDIDTIREDKTTFNWLLDCDEYLRKFHVDPELKKQVGTNLQKIISLYSFLAMHSGIRNLANEYTQLGIRHQFQDWNYWNIYSQSSIVEDKIYENENGAEIKFEDIDIELRPEKNTAMKNACLYLAKELRSQIIKLINQYQEDIFANDSKLEDIYSQYRAKAIDMAGISTAQITQAINHLGLSNRIFQADPPRIKGTWEQSTYEAILNIHTRGKICMKFHANGMPYVQDFGKEKAVDTDKLIIKNLRKEPYIERNTFYAGDQKHKLSHVIMPYSMAKILDLASFYRLITNIDDEALAVSVSEECHILFDDNELTYEEMKEKIEQKLNEICIEDHQTFTP